jgi:hypothetical protein
MQHLEGSGTPVLYIGRKVLKGYSVTYAAESLGNRRIIQKIITSINNAY